MSGWLPITAGMSQGSYLGPLMFIIIISGLGAVDVTHRYVDDISLTEFLNHLSVVNSQHAVIR